MPIVVAAAKNLVVGQATVIEGSAPEGHFCAVFEDDGQTGYFYALDMSVAKQPIQDALHIYNVAQVADREKPSMVKIGWSTDSQKVVLMINDYPHAVFDFEGRQGYCRTGFPPADLSADWSRDGHGWNEAAIGLFS